MTDVGGGTCVHAAETPPGDIGKTEQTQDFHHAAQQKRMVIEPPFVKSIPQAAQTYNTTTSIQALYT